MVYLTILNIVFCYRALLFCRQHNSFKAKDTFFSHEELVFLVLNSWSSVYKDEQR